MKKISSPAYYFKLKNILFLNRGLIFFSNDHIRNVISTLPNFLKIDVENNNFVSTLSNVVQFNVEKHNDVVKSYQPKTNVEPTEMFAGKVKIIE